MSLNLYLAYIAACIVLALVPGPIVTLLIANGLRYGTRAAMINILGAQAGLVIVIGIVSIGLTSMIATMGYWFDWVRLAGAVYLIWLGIKLIRFPVEGIKLDEPPPPPRGGFFLQGLLVLLSNPKLLVFFGAFIPQFIDMKGDHASQVTLLGATHATGVAHIGRLHDRGRRLARADTRALTQAQISRLPRKVASIPSRIRASRSAHCRWPVASAIRSWRI